MEAQRLLAEHASSQGVAVRVRMGLHTGEPIVSRTGYVGMSVTAPPASPIPGMAGRCCSPRSQPGW